MKSQLQKGKINVAAKHELEGVFVSPISSITKNNESNYSKLHFTIHYRSGRANIVCPLVPDAIIR